MCGQESKITRRAQEHKPVVSQVLSESPGVAEKKGESGKASLKVVYDAKGQAYLRMRKSVFFIAIHVVYTWQPSPSAGHRMRVGSPPTSL
jgi:hypothetical protein